MPFGTTGAAKGAQRQPPLISLLSSARVIVGADPDLRWEMGFTLAPEPCPESTVIDPYDSSEEKVAPPHPAEVPNQPFGVWAGATCSTFSRDEQNELPGKAIRRLESSQSMQIASELWEGTKSQAAGWGNQYLANGPVVLGNELDPVDAYGCLSQALGEFLAGSPGMIHATRQVVGIWKAAQLVVRDGTRLFDIYGNIVIPDAGYTGTSPDGEPDEVGESWAYGTGMVEVRMSEVTMVPDTNQANWIQQAIHRHPTDPEQNSTEVLAERVVSVIFDDCAHVAVGCQVTPCAGLLYAS